MWEFHSAQVQMQGNLGMFAFAYLMLSHLTSFPCNFWVRRPAICISLLILNQEQQVHPSIQPSIHPFSWILTLFSSLLVWKWSRLHWKGTFNPNDDSCWHSLWSLGKSPCPSNTIPPECSCLSWTLFWPGLPSCGSRGPWNARGVIAEFLLMWVSKKILRRTRFWQCTNHFNF